MEIRSKNITFVDPKTLKPNPKNMNHHSEEQISRLKQIILYQGFRNPIIVSNQSGYVNQGHARLLAALELNLEKVPVIYQDFDSEEQEYAAMVSDNAIASWAELDWSAINAELANLGPDFDINMLGIENFKIDSIEKENFDNTELDSNEFILSIKCKDEKDCASLYDEFKTRGYECKIIR
jgi:hypothetical protein